MSALELFIPGPTQVRREILEAQALPMIGHRGEAMKTLLADCLPGVRECFGTAGDVVLLTAPSTAAMEGVCRGVVRPGRRALHLLNGNFSKLWSELSQACGVPAAVEEKPWGAGWDEAAVRAVLGRHEAVDAVFVTHCETSTGALSDLAGVVRAVREGAPEAVVCADVTSSACGVPVDLDAIDLDVAVGGVQKAWALPPGLSLGAVSRRALVRMREVPHRGYTCDLLAALQFQNEKKMTATTPVISIFQALRAQIRDIRAAGGFAARHARHRAMQELVLDWCERRGFSVLAEPGARSPTVTSIACEGRFEVPDLLAHYRAAGYDVGAGYGKTQSTHWRIGHMGDHTPEGVARLLSVTDEFLRGRGLL